LLSPNFYVLPALSSKLSVFSKLCIMKTLLHFLLLLCQSCRSLRNESLGGRIVGLIKSFHHGWLSMMTSSQGPLFSLASPPATLNPPLRIAFVVGTISLTCELFSHSCSCFRSCEAGTDTTVCGKWCFVLHV